jgi:hypothetical protein
LGQRKEGRVHAIYYASKTLNEAQLNYANMEKELQAVAEAGAGFEPCVFKNPCGKIFFGSLNYSFITQN